MKTLAPIKLPPAARRIIKDVTRHEAEMTAAAHAGADTPIRFTLSFGEEEINFEFGARAHFRMGTADQPFELTDCSNAKRAHAATVTWLWACLCRHEADDFPEPEDLAEMIPFDRLLECTKAFIKAITDYNAARKVAKKAEAAKPAAASPAKD